MELLLRLIVWAFNIQIIGRYSLFVPILLPIKDSYRQLWSFLTRHSRAFRRLISRREIIWSDWILILEIDNLVILLVLPFLWYLPQLRLKRGVGISVIEGLRALQILSLLLKQSIWHAVSCWFHSTNPWVTCPSRS